MYHKPRNPAHFTPTKGKNKILPRANNGMQLVYSFVAISDGTVPFNYSNECKNFTACFLKNYPRHC